MSVFRKKKKTTVNSVKCRTTVCTHDTFCPLELNLWQLRTNPVSGRAEYLNPGPPNYESSILNPQPYCLLLKCSVFRDSKHIQSFWKVMKKKKIIFLIDVFLCTSVLPAESLWYLINSSFYFIFDIKQGVVWMSSDPLSSRKWWINRQTAYWTAGEYRLFFTKSIQLILKKVAYNVEFKPQVVEGVKKSCNCNYRWYLYLFIYFLSRSLRKCQGHFLGKHSSCLVR